MRGDAEFSCSVDIALNSIGDMYYTYVTAKSSRTKLIFNQYGTFLCILTNMQKITDTNTTISTRHRATDSTILYVTVYGVTKVDILSINYMFSAKGKYLTTVGSWWQRITKWTV